MVKICAYLVRKSCLFVFRRRGFKPKLRTLFIAPCRGLFDDVGYYSPHLEVGFVVHPNLGKFRVGWHEPHSGFAYGDSFERKLAIEVAHGDGAIVRVERFIHNNYVAVGDSGVDHRVAGNAGAECR